MLNGHHFNYEKQTSCEGASFVLTVQAKRTSQSRTPKTTTATSAAAMMGTRTGRRRGEKV